MTMIKKTLFLLYLLYNTSSYAISNSQKPINVRVQFEKNIPIEEQWVYWFCTCKNEHQLLDSFYYSPVIQEYNIQGTGIRNCISLEELVFAKCKRSIRFNVLPGDSVTIHVIPNEKYKFIWEVYGSKVH